MCTMISAMMTVGWRTRMCSTMMIGWMFRRREVPREAVVPVSR